MRGNENQLDRLQGVGHRERNTVGVGAIGLAIAVKSEGRQDGNNSLIQQGMEKLGIDALHFSGKQVVDALKDSERMGNDGVRAGAAQVVGGKAFQDFVGQPVGGVERQLQSWRVGDAGAVQVRGRDALLLRQRLDLRRRSMHQHHADVQGTQHGDVEKDIGEVLIRDDDAVDGNDKVFSRNCGMYWRIPRRSVSFTLAPCRIDERLQPSSRLATIPIYTKTSHDRPGRMRTAFFQAICNMNVT